MNVSVINPIYEKVSLKFNVKFIEGYNEKLGFKKLKDKIISFLDPWKISNACKVHLYVCACPWYQSLFL